jgi:molybdenum cofactor biosynthesis enzyme MoaA
MRKIVSHVRSDSIVAVRSLMCADHAHNIEPTVLTVHWLLSKRCNYDCSYCSDHWHDFVSPHHDIQVIEKFINRIDKQARDNNKKIKWLLTGGEPFLHPSIVEILKLLKQTESFSQLNTITNGSLPLSVYEQSLDYLDGLTISVHLERTIKEVAKSINTAIELTKMNKGFVNVNLMFLPGKLEQVKDICSQFDKNNVKYVVRRISPFKDTKGTAEAPFQGTRKSAVLDSVDLQKHKREQYRIENDQNLDYSMNYTKDEITFFKTRPDTQWQNIGVWDSNGKYVEMNTDDLVSLTKHSFTYWKCFIGTDQIYVGFDGSIYKASCLVDGTIGHINDDSSILFNTHSDPVTCTMNWCTCNIDISTRKCKDNYIHLITENK